MAAAVLGRIVIVLPRPRPLRRTLPAAAAPGTAADRPTAASSCGPGPGAGPDAGPVVALHEDAGDVMLGVMGASLPPRPSLVGDEIAGGEAEEMEIGVVGRRET